MLNTTIKYGFIGAGNMGQAMITALVKSGTLSAGQIGVANRSPGKPKKLHETLGVKVYNTNEELIEDCEFVVLAVKPQDLSEMLEPVRFAFDQSHLVLSLAAGISLDSLHKLLPSVRRIARAMPNASTLIRRGVVGYCVHRDASEIESTIESFLKPMGLVMRAEEGDAFEGLMISCSSGPGFIFELMQYWQEYLEEHGFNPAQARQMVVETFLGTALLAERDEDNSLADLQDRVTSKKGVTAAGLQSMRELEVDRALRFSFEKAAIRNQELSRNNA